MRMRTGTIAAAAVIIVVGFAFGALLAVLARGSSDHAQPVAVAAKPHVAVAAIPPRTATPTMIAQSTATPVPTRPPAPSTPPSPVPARTGPPSPVVRTVTTPQVATAASDARKLQGSWQVDEANVQVGRIVWVGDAAPSGADTIVLDAHKESVGGRSAMPCERQTSLHAAFSLGAAQQSVPYRETNCQGVVSTGEVRVRTFSPNGSFTGSFWQNGVMLGNFQAHKR